MKSKNCEHYDLPQEHRICPHLWEKTTDDYGVYFTGEDQNHVLICIKCREIILSSDPIKDTLIQWVSTCRPCFIELEAESCWDNCEQGVLGRPQLKEKPVNFIWKYDLVDLPKLTSASLHTLTPSPCSSRWFTLDSSGGFWDVDFIQGQSFKLPPLPVLPEELDVNPLLLISPNGQWAALANRYGQKGMVWEIKTGDLVMYLDRGNYHIERCTFSIAFAEHQGRTLLIYATDWNRLEMIDLTHNQTLTTRPSTQFKDAQASVGHYLDYFRSGLSISPDHRWIVDNGWVWAPVGVIIAWDLHKWLENPWESEDGASMKRLAYRDYYWDGPLCWLDSDHLGVWGYGTDDENLIPALLIFHIPSGELKRWFFGPKGDLYVHDYLFSCSERGTQVWDIAEGALVHDQPNLKPLGFHSNPPHFITTDSQGRFQRVEFESITPL